MSSSNVTEDGPGVTEDAGTVSAATNRGKTKTVPMRARAASFREWSIETYMRLFDFRRVLCRASPAELEDSVRRQDHGWNPSESRSSDGIERAGSRHGGTPELRKIRVYQFLLIHRRSANPRWRFGRKGGRFFTSLPEVGLGGIPPVRKEFFRGNCGTGICVVEFRHGDHFP